MGLAFRHVEHLQAWGAASGTESSCAIQVRGAHVPFHKGCPIMHRMLIETHSMPSGMGCALREYLCLSGKGSAFRHGERLQEVEALCREHRAWRLHGILSPSLSVLPREAVWNSVSPFLCVLPLQFLQALGVTTAVTRSNCRH